MKLVPSLSLLRCVEDESKITLRIEPGQSKTTIRLKLNKSKITLRIESGKRNTTIRMKLVQSLSQLW